MAAGNRLREEPGGQRLAVPGSRAQLVVLVVLVVPGTEVQLVAQVAQRTAALLELPVVPVQLVEPVLLERPVPGQLAALERSAAEAAHRLLREAKST